MDTPEGIGRNAGIARRRPPLTWPRQTL